MTFLDRVVLARADEQSAQVRWDIQERAGHYDGRTCGWPERVCGKLLVYWNKSGLCQIHFNTNKARARPYERKGQSWVRA